MWWQSSKANGGENLCCGVPVVCCRGESQPLLYDVKGYQARNHAGCKEHDNKRHGLRPCLLSVCANQALFDGMLSLLYRLRTTPTQLRVTSARSRPARSWKGRWLTSGSTWQMTTSRCVPPPPPTKNAAVRFESPRQQYSSSATFFRGHTLHFQVMFIL